MYVGMCVCVYCYSTTLCHYLHKCTHTCAREYAHASSTSEHISIYPSMHIQIDVCLHIHICIYMYDSNIYLEIWKPAGSRSVDTHKKYMLIYVYIYINICLSCMYIHMYKCIYVWIYNSHTYMKTHRLKISWQLTQHQLGSGAPDTTKCYCRFMSHLPSAMKMKNINKNTICTKELKYICIHICMYIYSYIHAGIYVYAYTYMFTYIYQYIHTYIYIYVNTYICTYMYIHIHICI